MLVGEQATGLTVDHNLYLSFSIGKFRSQLVRKTIENWRYLSGLDAHSVSIPVKYEDAAKGLFKAVNVLDWALDRPVTAAWGSARLAGKEAPTEDIDGVKRPTAPAVGAYEVSTRAPRAADGEFIVSSGQGVTSAGVFDSNDKLVAYLFQTLPLAQGKYSFWLPSRTYRAEPIEAGDYEVRVLESKLDWKYKGFIGNTGAPDVVNASPPGNIDALAFDNHGRLHVGCGISEAHVNIRSCDAATGKWRWLFNGTSAMHGLASASDGLLYVLRQDANQMRLSRLDAATGEVSPWGKTDYGSLPFKKGANCTGLASLGNKLFFTDTVGNAVRIGTTESPESDTAIEVKQPLSPAADNRTNVVWVISGGEKLVAVSADGKLVGQSQAVEQPMSIAVRDGRLAVASRKSGKVHLFDCSDPSELKPLSTLGRGDGPDGLILSDRFWFQWGEKVNLALGPNGQVAVGEAEGRLQVFDREGNLIWWSFSIWGAGAAPSRLTPGRVFSGPFTMLLDGEKSTWRLESFHRALNDGRILGDCQIGGNTFVVLNSLRAGDATPGEKKPSYWMRISFVNFTPEKATQVGGMVWKSVRTPNEPWTYRYDDNRDGQVDQNDKVAFTLTDAEGKLITRPLFDHRFTYLQPNGELTISGSGEGWLARWPCAGLDEHGSPTYRYADRVVLTGEKDAVISPYDHKPTGPGMADHMLRGNGGWVGLKRCSGAPWKVMINNGGTDIVAIDDQHQVDWVQPLAHVNVVGSLTSGDGLYIAALADSYDCLVLNDDGLMLNGFSPAAGAGYVGHWVDDPTTVRTFVDQQGKVNVLMCDYMVCACNHWYRLENKEVRLGKFALKIKPQAAAELAALPAKTLDITAGKPATPLVRIPLLKEPLTIDGDMQKWRDAGINPQFILTPESSNGIEGGPSDCSAIARLAYHGQDLYLQVFRFDDVITSHQPKSRACLQDTVEMTVNGFWEGIKHNLSMTTDAGPVNQVDGRGLKAHTLDTKDSPIVIKVLDNARDVVERQIIENIYGVDMSNCKVQLFETKIPMDAKTYAGRPEARFELKSGQQFWLGFLIDDNDQLGTDLQNFLLWPTTYGTFGTKEEHGLAELE